MPYCPMVHQDGQPSTFDLCPSRWRGGQGSEQGTHSREGNDDTGVVVAYVVVFDGCSVVVRLQS